MTRKQVALELDSIRLQAASIRNHGPVDCRDYIRGVEHRLASLIARLNAPDSLLAACKSMVESGQLTPLTPNTVKAARDAIIDYEASVAQHTEG